MPLNTTCAVCGSTLEYESAHSMAHDATLAEQVALTKWVEAHGVCLRDRAGAAALPIADRQEER